MRNQPKHPANPIWYNLSQKRWNTCQLEETDSPHFPIELKERNLKSMNKKKRIQNKPAANRPRTASVERKRYATNNEKEPMRKTELEFMPSGLQNHTQMNVPQHIGNRQLEEKKALKLLSNSKKKPYRNE